MSGYGSHLDGAETGRRAYRQPMSLKDWHGWTPDTGPSRVLAPRCGRPLVLDGRYERGGEPGDPGRPPVCGRREDHAPPCRSEAAVARYYRADRDRQAAARADAWDLAAPALSVRLTGV